MIAGYHIIFSTYGFWLPNDPRGSWSEFVGAWDLFRYGAVRTTTERRSIAYREHDRSLRRIAKSELKYPPVNFTGTQARAVARGFADYVRQVGLVVWACAILPDHVHLVTGRPHLLVEKLVVQVKAAATRQLDREGLHPLAQWRRPDGRPPKCWVRGQWKVYLDPPDVQRAIVYVENNPLKEGKKKQTWSFVVPFSC